MAWLMNQDPTDGKRSHPGRPRGSGSSNRDDRDRDRDRDRNTDRRR